MNTSLPLASNKYKDDGKRYFAKNWGRVKVKLVENSPKGKGSVTGSN